MDLFTLKYNYATLMNHNEIKVKQINNNIHFVGTNNLLCVLLQFNHSGVV